MGFLTRIVISLIFLLFVGCVYAHQTAKEEIVFIREYREYGWKEYGADAVKLPRPIQTLVDFYLVEYRLDANHLTIAKLSASHPPVRTALFTALLSRAQRRATQKMLRTADLETIQQQCNANTITVDDGFHLDIMLTKPSDSKSFRWDGNYVSELVAFVDMVNNVSPRKYKFYESGKQEAFKQSLLHRADAP